MSTQTPSHLARTPEQKFVLLFEAVKRSFLAAQELQRHLAADLLSFEQDILSGIEIGERAISPLLAAISFVDFAHRFGSLVDSLPLLNKRAPEIRRLRSSLVVVEKARNHLQHLRGDLSSNDEINYALLGELCWTNQNVVFLLSLTQPSSVERASISFDVHNKRWTAKHRYIVKDVWVDFDPTLAEMRGAFEWISTKVTFGDPEFSSLTWGKTLAVACRLRIENQAGGPDTALKSEISP